MIISRMISENKSAIINVNKIDRKDKQRFMFTDAVLPKELIYFSIIQVNAA